MLKQSAENVARVLPVAAMMLYGSTALAQSATQTRRPGQVIPLTGTEPAAKLVIDSPGMPPGRHRVLIELVDANHQVVDRGTVTLDVPQTAAGASLEPKQ